MEYCEWIAESTFEFSFCDVLAQRVAAGFSASDIELKAALVVSCVRMAVNHNRWYAMRKALQLCGPELQDSVASRIAIDVQAFELKDSFRSCVTVTGEGFAKLHPILRAIIEPETEQ